MRASHRSLLALVAVSSIIAVGCTGSQGPAGNPGPTGPPGSPAPQTGVVAGTVTDAVAAGNPALANVSVTASDSGGGSLGSATTDANGKFSITLPVGVMYLQFALPYYTSPAPLQVGVISGQTVRVGVAMSEAASGAPSVILSGPTEVGFGASVPLTVTATSPLGYPLTYAWSDATWPLYTPAGAVAGNGTSATVTMPTMAQAFAYRYDSKSPGSSISGYTLEDRIGVIPILPDTQGTVTAQVVVSDGHGQKTTASVAISAAGRVNPVAAIPLGSRVYLNSGHDGANAWTLTAPNGSSATLDDPTIRTPSFVLDVASSVLNPLVFKVKETAVSTANALSLSGGLYYGMVAGGTDTAIVPDPSCQGTCHNGILAPDKFTPWAGTKHASMFARGIDGFLSSHYSGACVECHTVGSGAANDLNDGGFDQVAQQEGWSFPAKLGTDNWSTMLANNPGLARLANIQCESCHGPNISGLHPQRASYATPFQNPRIDYSAEVCGTCHAEGSHHHRYSDWNTLDPATGYGHSNRGTISIGAGASGLSTSCGRCHSAQGYTLYAGILQQGKVALTSIPASTLAAITTANGESVTCVACHDPHDATNPNQLRFYGDTPNLPGGFAGYGMGKGATCLTCHNSRNGAQTGSDTLTYLHEDGETYNGGNPTGYSAPHQAAQGDVFMGRNAYFMGTSLPMLSRHAAIEDTCVGCHMTLQPTLPGGATGHRFFIQDGDKTALCSNCHGTGTVNGEAIQAGMEAQLAKLDSKMGAAAMAKMNGIPGGTFRVTAIDPASGNSSAANVPILVAGTSGTPNPVTAVTLVEIHGQIGLNVTLTSPQSFSGLPNPLQTFQVQLGNLKDNSSTPKALYALSGNFVRAGWNRFLVEGDQSKGLHNPTFVTAVLDASIGKDLSN